MNTKNLIEMKGISKKFFATQALSNVNFSCTSGEVHALVGLNGAGKSTLMKALGGVVNPDEGSILLNEKSVSIAKPADAGKLGISMIHQEYSLINEITVAGNIFLGRELHYTGSPFLNKREMAKRVQKELDRFGLQLDPKSPVRFLNSGEKQIVEIIRALMSESWLIVMDEPTSALSEEDKRHLFTFINRMKLEGISIVYISHHMPEIFDIADRVTVMRDGQVVLQEPIEKINEDMVIHAMTGKELEDFVKPSKEISDDLLLSVKNISKNDEYKGISFDVHRGEIVVLTGLRGCGAPELTKAIFGLEGGYSGEIYYRGTLLKSGSGPAFAVRHGMGFVTENRDKNGILAPLSVCDNIILPFLEQVSNLGFIDVHAIDETVDKAIKGTSTKTASPDQEIRFLSGGNKQKVCFSRWLNDRIRLLILLEPTRGIDVHAKADIYRIIEELAKKGVGILLLSYEIDEVIMLADRVVTMYRGDTIAQYTSGVGFDKNRMLSDMAGVALP